MEPGEAFELVFESPEAGYPEIENGEDYISVHGWSKATVDLFQGSLIPYQSPEKSIQEIVNEELLRFETVSLSGNCVESLKTAITNADFEFDQWIMEAEGSFLTPIQAVALLISHLAKSLNGAASTLTRIVWRVCSRILTRVHLYVQLSMNSAEELFSVCIADDKGAPEKVLEWLVKHTSRLEIIDAKTLA